MRDCETMPTLLCDYAFQTYRAEDPEDAARSYRRMTERMGAICADVKRRVVERAGGEGLDDGAFTCLRYATLQLGAAGYPAGRIVPQESDLAPNAVREDWDGGLATLGFLCATQACEERDSPSAPFCHSPARTAACELLGDLARAVGDEARAAAHYAVGCYRNWAIPARAERCIEEAPVRGEAIWVNERVRHGAVEHRDAVLAAATTPVVRSPCVGRWRGELTSPRSGTPGELEVEVVGEPQDDVCGTWTTAFAWSPFDPNNADGLTLEEWTESHPATGDRTTWTLSACRWEGGSGRMAATAGGVHDSPLNGRVELRTMRLTFACTDATAEVETRTERMPGDDPSWQSATNTRSLRRP